MRCPYCRGQAIFNKEENIWNCQKKDCWAFFTVEDVKEERTRKIKNVYRRTENLRHLLSIVFIAWCIGWVESLFKLNILKCLNNDISINLFLDYIFNGLMTIGGIIFATFAIAGLCAMFWEGD